LHVQEKMHLLRERLEEERLTVLNRESEKAELEARIGRLTRIVLNSTRALLHTPASGRNPLHSTSNLSPLMSRESPSMSQRGFSARPTEDDDFAFMSQHSARSSVQFGTLRSVGDIHCGTAMSLYDFDSPYLAENDILREHLRMLTEEMEVRGIHVAAPSRGTDDMAPSRSQSGAMDTAQPCSAAADARQVLALQGGLQQLQGGAQQAAEFASAATTAAASGGSAAVPSELLERLQQMEAHVQSMLEQLEAKDLQLARERRMLERFRELEQQVEMQLRTVTQVRTLRMTILLAEPPVDLITASSSRAPSCRRTSACGRTWDARSSRPTRCRATAWMAWRARSSQH